MHYFSNNVKWFYKRLRPDAVAFVSGLSAIGTACLPETGLFFIFISIHDIFFIGSLIGCRYKVFLI